MSHRRKRKIITLDKSWNELKIVIIYIYIYIYIYIIRSLILGIINIHQFTNFRFIMRMVLALDNRLKHKKQPTNPPNKQTNNQKHRKTIHYNSLCKVPKRRFTESEIANLFFILILLFFSFFDWKLKEYKWYKTINTVLDETSVVLFILFILFYE